MTSEVHEANREAVTCHKMTLERNGDGTTAEEPAVRREKETTRARGLREKYVDDLEKNQKN